MSKNGSSSGSIAELLKVKRGVKGPVFSEEFSLGFGRYLTKALVRDEDFDENSPNYCGDDYSALKVSRELLDVCNAHVEESTKIKESNPEAYLVLVHPFYLHLSHEHYLEDRTRKQAIEYTNRLGLVLNSRLDRERLGIIVLDDIHHYAAATSLLLEQGRVDRVIFTKCDSGYILNKGDLDFMADKEIYLGGLYSGTRRAVQAVASQLNLVTSPEQVLQINGLMLSSPQNNPLSLEPEKITSFAETEPVKIGNFLDDFDLNH